MWSLYCKAQGSQTAGEDGVVFPRRTHLERTLPHGQTQSRRRPGQVCRVVRGDCEALYDELGSISICSPGLDGRRASPRSASMPDAPLACCATAPRCHPCRLRAAAGQRRRVAGCHMLFDAKRSDATQAERRLCRTHLWQSLAPPRGSFVAWPARMPRRAAEPRRRISEMCRPASSAPHAPGPR